MAPTSSSEPTFRTGPRTRRTASTSRPRLAWPLRCSPSCTTRPSGCRTWPSPSTTRSVPFETSGSKATRRKRGCPRRSSSSSISRKTRRGRSGWSSGAWIATRPMTPWRPQRPGGARRSNRFVCSPRTRTSGKPSPESASSWWTDRDSASSTRTSSFASAASVRRACPIGSRWSATRLTVSPASQVSARRPRPPCSARSSTWSPFRPTPPHGLPESDKPSASRPRSPGRCSSRFSIESWRRSSTMCLSPRGLEDLAWSGVPRGAFEAWCDRVSSTSLRERPTRWAP